MSSSAVRVSDQTPERSGAWSWFCGQCGRRPADGGAPARFERVCKVCGFGLLQRAAADTAPKVDEAFLIVDSSLAVQAVSARAQAQLGVSEESAVNRHLTELLLPADAIASSTFAAAIGRAARGEGAPSRVHVRPATVLAARTWARIASCGPPHAALVVLE